jgi:catechol 2,3-dioxygenase-like lactoylglutathione lyase family enzyme
MTLTRAPIQVRTIDHVTIVVKDLEASRRFYVDLLGMDEVPRPAFKFAGKWFQAGPAQIHLILEIPESGPAGLADPRRSASTRANHFAFQVDDSHAAAVELERLGYPLLSPPKNRPDGAVQTFVQDPDGYVVELFSWA